MDDFKSFKLERFSNSAGQKNVGIDQQNLSRRGNCRVHVVASAQINFSSATTATVSSPRDSMPLTYGGSLPVSGTLAALASSHSPVTGTAVSSCRAPILQFAIK